MGYFEDLGTTIDISLEEVGTFMEQAEDGVVRFSAIRTYEVAENAGPMIVVTSEG